MNVFVFDIETVPDVNAGRILHKLDDTLSDEEVAQIMFRQALEDTGQQFVKLPLHKIVAISALYRRGDQLKVWSLGEEQSSEKEIVQRFFDGIEKYGPQLVSWNGSGFDLPVLQYRALFLKVMAKKYFETGESDASFKWNNYINRYHQRHLDLMDLMAAFQTRANASLNDIASLLGFPGKFGMDGSKVWDTYLNGGIKAIRDYCETDVINTYCVYLRFQLLRGHIDEKTLEHELSFLRETLSEMNAPHINDFLEAWDNHPKLAYE